MRTKLYGLITALLICAASFAQDNNYGVKGFYPQTFDITEQGTVTLNGLKAGFEIRETDLDSKKDNQSRYKIYFYLTNTGTEAKIMYRNLDFGGHSGDINNNMALFKCTNATGARLTNKTASMELKPCMMQAKVEDKDCNGKTVTNTRIVDIGYWIKPGETVSKTHPMYVPKDERPKITVTFYAEVGNQTGTFLSPVSQQQVETSFARLKNFAFNTYLNTQSGSLTCSTIDNGWWSADWQVMPVEGTNNFLLKNRWKGNYISNSNGLLTSDANNTSAMWTIQETNMPNVFYIKNVADNARLYVENGTLKISSSFISNDNATKWIIEK